MFVRLESAHYRWVRLPDCNSVQNTIGEHWETLERLAAAQTSVKELESDVSRSSQGNKVATLLMGVNAGLQGKLADARAQSKRDLSALQAPADIDQNMLHAVVLERTRVQLPLDSERQKRQNV